MGGRVVVPCAPRALAGCAVQGQQGTKLRHASITYSFTNIASFAWRLDPIVGLSLWRHHCMHASRSSDPDHGHLHCSPSSQAETRAAPRLLPSDSTSTKNKGAHVTARACACMCASTRRATTCCSHPMTQTNDHGEFRKNIYIYSF